MTNMFSSNHKMFKELANISICSPKDFRAWPVVSLKLKGKKRKKITLDEPKTYPAGGIFLHANPHT